MSNDPTSAAPSDSSEEGQRALRLEKISSLRARGVNPYPERFERSHTAAQAAVLEDGAAHVTMAGRLMAWREMGKLTFARLEDRSGALQIALRAEDLGADAYKALQKTLDIGDYVGVHGSLFTTKTGEKTLGVDAITLLGKALRPLPVTFSGLTDKEIRYRKRYLDLLVNEEARRVFRARAAAIRAIRTFLDGHGFEEVETPILVSTASGALAKHFTTHHDALDLDLSLRIAPETYLKRLIVGGYERVYEVAKCFRNEGLDPSHLQEFTQVEYYAAYWNYEDNMRFTEELLAHILMTVLGTLVVHVDGKDIDFAAPWPRRRFMDLFREEAGVDPALLTSVDAVRRVAKEQAADVDLPEGIGLPNALDALYKKLVRPKLIQPQFIIAHPADLKPLARRNDADPALADSFQLLVNSWEIVNAYSELVDPIVQRHAFEFQADAREAGDEEAMAAEEDYLEAMEYGMPPISGWGMGIDRLIALLTDQPSLRDTVFFPTMRPESTGRETPADEIASAGLSRDDAFEKLVKAHADPKMIPHLLGNEVAMRTLATHFGHSAAEETWGIAGLLHDYDYTTGMDEATHMGSATRAQMLEAGLAEDFVDEVRAHNAAQGIEPKTTMGKTLFAVDELVGLIQACAYVQPSKKVVDVKAESVLKKFKQKSFAANVRRDLILTCETKLSTPLKDFVEITLRGLQGASEQIGM